MAVALVWAQLAGSAAVILVAAHFLAKSAAVISDRTGIGRSIIGVVLLATATSLPELGTGVSAVTLVGEPDLAAGDAFGSNLFNLLILGIADVAWRRGPLLNAVSGTSAFVGVLGAVIIGTAALTVFLSSTTSVLPDWPVSPLSVLLLLLFLVAMYLIFRYEQAHGDADGGGGAAATGPSLTRGLLVYGVSATVIVGASVALAATGDRLATAMGWEATFVGTQFLALSTSLPELATSLAAIRLRYPELAVTNVLGSNVFNMGMVLFLDDVAYTSGPLWREVSPVHALSGAGAVLMSGIVIVAILRRGRRRPGTFWTWEALGLLGVYGAASVLVYRLG